MNLKVDGTFISEITDEDKAAYLEHFKEREIADQTLNIPFPYRPKDADEWLLYLHDDKTERGVASNWAIRRKDGFLIGGIGLHNWDPKHPHRVEIGYWLAKPYWGKGITTEAVKVITGYAFQDLHISRVAAQVFEFNRASARVLEKAGYQFEGTLRKHYFKNGKFYNGSLYARLSE